MRELLVNGQRYNIPDKVNPLGLSEWDYITRLLEWVPKAPYLKTRLDAVLERYRIP